MPIEILFLAYKPIIISMEMLFIKVIDKFTKEQLSLI